MKINKCDSKYSLDRQFVITLGTFSSLEKLVACPVMVTELNYNSPNEEKLAPIQTNTEMQNSSCLVDQLFPELEQVYWETQFRNHSSANMFHG